MQALGVPPQCTWPLRVASHWLAYVFGLVVAAMPVPLTTVQVLPAPLRTVSQHVCLHSVKPANETIMPVHLHQFEVHSHNCKVAVWKNTPRT